MLFFNILFGAVQLGLIVYILFKEAERKSPAMFLWATLLLMFGFPHLLTVVSEDMPYQDITLLNASIFVVFFCIIYLVFRSKKHVSFIDLTQIKGFNIDNDRIAYSLFEAVCFILLLFSIVDLLRSKALSQGGLLNISWRGSREIEQSYVSLVGLEIRLMHMGAGLSMYFFLTSRRWKAYIVLLMQIVVVVITRNRAFILPIFIFVTMLYITKMRRIKLKHIIYAALTAFSFIYILYAFRAFRWLGSLSDGLTNLSFEYLDMMVWRFIDDKSGELGLRQWFYYFIEKGNQFDGFNRGYSYIRMALVYLPSQWSLGLKPSSFDIYMGAAIGMSAGGSMHPTLFGDCFANMDWVGVLLGGFWAAFANFFDRLIVGSEDSFHKIMIYFMISYSYVIMGRGSVYNGFEATAWGILILHILDLLLKSLYKYKIKGFSFLCVSEKRGDR